MELRLPLNRLVCSPCAEEHRNKPAILDPDAVMAEIIVPQSDGKIRTVPIQVIRLTFEELDDGRVRGHVKARIPCIDCHGKHEIDVSDVYRAPELHLQGEARCAHGHKMKFERRSLWDYVDEGEHGGVIEVAGLLTCDECRSRGEATLRFGAPDMAKAQASGSIELDLSTARPVPGGPLQEEAKVPNASDGSAPDQSRLRPFMNEALPEDILANEFARASLLDYYSTTKERPFAGLHIACVLHFLKDLIPFFRALVRLGGDPEKMTFFHKTYPYPQRDAVAAYLRSKKADVRPLSALDEWLREQESANDRIFLFIEDGGYITPKLLHELPGLRSRTRLVVEQTTKGRRNIEGALAKLPKRATVGFPILSVASCKLKGEFEPRFIADSFEQNLKNLLPDVPLPGSSVGLIGYGAIGRAVAAKLKTASAIVTVYDERPQNRVVASNDGFSVAATKLGLLKDKRWIVGCTGNEVISEGEFYHLSDSTYLISCSSEKYEFDVEELDKIANGSDLAPDRRLVGRSYELKGTNNQRIILVADGYPLNFWGINSMPEPLGDFIMSVLLLAARFGLTEKPKNDIDADAVDRILEAQEIAKRFEERHLKRLG